MNCVDRAAGPNWKWSSSTKNSPQRGITVGGVTRRDDECRVLLWGFIQSMHPRRSKYKVFMAICTVWTEPWAEPMSVGLRRLSKGHELICWNSLLFWAVYISDLSKQTHGYAAIGFWMKSCHGTLGGHFRSNKYLPSENDRQEFHWHSLSKSEFSIPVKSFWHLGDGNRSK